MMMMYQAHVLARGRTIIYNTDIIVVGSAFRHKLHAVKAHDFYFFF